MDGFIKLHRQIINWEWYTDINTKTLFFHCLLKANYKDAKWRGQFVQSGSFITSYEKLSNETGLTNRQIRTSIEKLKKTNEIVVKTTHQNTVISLVKWGDYQIQDSSCDTQNVTQTTSERQTTDKRATTNNKYKNIKNDKNEEYIEQKSSRFVAPTFDQVSEYVEEIKSQVDPQRFIDFYESKGWMVGRNKMKDWKAAVRTWQKSSFTKNRIEIVSDYPIKEVNISDNEADEIKRSLKSLGGH